MKEATWQCLGPDVDAIFAATGDPLRGLAHGEFAALVLRQAVPAAACADLVEFLLEQGLMYATTEDVVAAKAVPSGVTDQWTQLDLNPDGSSRRRLDIGTSLGNIGEDQERFFEHAAATRLLFRKLFASRLDPVAVVYDYLARLAPGKRVVTAHEADGREYGPAIFRVHYGGYTYGPHFDSVRRREGRRAYAVYRYEHQFAGVLCIQNSQLEGRSAQGIVYNQPWNEEVDGYLKAGRFHELAVAQDIEKVQVDLEPGDLYFFNTGNIHEVPGVPGRQPRVVLATFVGFSEYDGEVMVWS